jgi:hypothetical protein
LHSRSNDEETEGWSNFSQQSDTQELNKISNDRI